MAEGDRHEASRAAAAPHTGRLRRDLGTLESYAALLGILIGAGIFTVTSYAWSLTGPGVILGYLVLFPVILATSLPKTGYSARAVLAVYRLRWQIELAFKRLKSLLHIDRLPTWTERGSRSWLYAHLILALLCDDLSQDFLDSSP